MKPGEKYNRLTAIADTGKKDSQGLKIWTFQCDCGNIVEKTASYVQRGRTKSCGCLAKEKLKERNDKAGYIEIGTRFGSLEVIEDLGYKEVSNGRRIRFSKCKCDCGNIIEVRNNNLKSGGSTSCGCQSSRGEKIIANLLTQNNIHFIKEYTFSDLIGPNGGRLRFDFAIFHNKKLYELIEFDGRQHFLEPEGSWSYNLKEIQQHDELKNQYCKKHNIKLIHIPYTEIGEITLEKLNLQII